MSFTVGNVQKFLSDIGGYCNESRAQQIIQSAEDIAYLNLISGAHIAEVMQEFADLFERRICNSKDHFTIFTETIAAFNVQDDKLRKLRDGVEKALIAGGFKKRHVMKQRGFEILNVGEDMAVYNTVGHLAGEKVKDLGIVIMSIGFDDMDDERELGGNYKNCLEANGYTCSLLETLNCPKEIGAVYLYVKPKMEV
jgi:hypothetical protein